MGKSPRSMKTFCPRSVRRNSTKARAALGFRAPARMAMGSGVTKAFLGATYLMSKPASFSSKAMYDGTAKPAANSPLATTVGTSRLRAVKCPVLAASRVSHSQPFSSPKSERMTSYVALDDDERVGAHWATSPLSLGLRRSSHSFGSGAPRRWMRLGLYTSPYGSSAVPIQYPSLSFNGMGLGLPMEAGMESHAAFEISTF